MNVYFLSYFWAIAKKGAFSKKAYLKEFKRIYIILRTLQTPILSGF